MAGESWLEKLQTAIEHEVFLIFLFNSNMLVKGEGGGDYLYDEKNRDDGDQGSDHDGDNASEKSQSESEDKDKDDSGKDKHDEERFYSKSFLDSTSSKSALKKEFGSKDNDDEKYAAELDPEGLVSLEEHLLLMEGRLIEDISNIVREELAEFKRLFVSCI